MALRRGTHAINQENVNSRFAAKSNIVQPNEVPKRAALIEVGNRHHAVQKVQDFKQHGLMGPPEAVLKKATCVPASKRDPFKIVPDDGVHTKKNTLLRQESILKNINNTTENKKLSLPTNSLTKRPSVIDPDENVKNFPQMVPEYLLEIFQYLREFETKLGISENFLDGHESTPRMRAILVNWLVEVHMNFEFTPETLNLCVAIVDRYLQENKKVGRSTLQLVGTSAMLIACKYEEVCTPDLEDFEYICDNSFSKRQILQMEVEILKRLDFLLGNPLSIQFLRRYNKIAQARIEHHTLGKYMLELALVEYEMSHIRPSIQAAAACCLSMGILSDTMDLQKLWTPTLVQYTSYEYNDFRSVIAKFAVIIAKSEKSKYQCTRKKYSSAKFGKISLNPKLNGPLVRKLTVTVMKK